MAYMNQDKKRTKSPFITALLKQYGMKGSLAVRDYSTLVLTLRSGALNLESLEGKAFLAAMSVVMNEGNYNNSDYRSDYHDVGWYVDIRVGTWDKPYLVNGTKPNHQAGPMLAVRCYS
jgi:hypothetical protein